MKMHHIAYKLMRGDRKPHKNKPASPRLFPRRQPDELIVPTSANSELALQEEVTSLRLENEKLKRNLEIKEIEVAALKEDVANANERLKGTFLTQEDEDQDNEVFGEGQDRLTPLPRLAGTQLHQELRIAGDALDSLRRCFDPSDPFQHTIETIEQSVKSLWERVVRAEGRTDDTDSKLHLDIISADYNRSNTTSLIGLPQSSLSSFGGFTNEFSTKLVYYTAKSTTPFVSVISKRLGDITLRDVKLALDRPGLFRCHFKTLDPDYGMVKEEVCNDDDLIPGWDDKIVAWIEEDVD